MKHENPQGDARDPRPRHAAPLHPSRAGASRPRARIHWATLAFLVGFTLLLIGIVSFTLVPGLEAATQPGVSDEEKKRLVAWYRLLLMIVLFILFAGLVLTFRFGRLFLPRPLPPRTQTPYVDVWAESAKRLKVPPEDEEDET